MANSYSNEPMLDMYIFETTQLLEQLEQVIISSEKSNSYTPDAINEIFRVMHTIKGSSAMMLFNNISTLAHSIEDLFFLLREEKLRNVDYSQLTDLVLEGVDFIKVETEKIKNGDSADGNAEPIIENIKGFLERLKQENISPAEPVINEHKDEENQKYYISRVKDPETAEINAYKAVIYFEEGCEMESIRAFTVIHNLKEIADEIKYIPEDIIDNDSCDEIIKKEGFHVFFKSAQPYENVKGLLMQTVFLRDIELEELSSNEEYNLLTGKSEISLEEPSVKVPQINENETEYKDHQMQGHTSGHQSIISVSVEKLDKLMDLMGEIVISEAMVTQCTSPAACAHRKTYKVSARGLSAPIWRTSVLTQYLSNTPVLS
jgi:two-component system chemotaxis sensor kinase CheA